MDDEVVVTARLLMEELTRKTTPMELILQPASVLQLAGLIQLANRHPHISDANRAVAARWLTRMREYFADCPTVLDLLERGDDPQEDQR
jgi:hypothetical protein